MATLYEQLCESYQSVATSTLVMVKSANRSFVILRCFTEANQFLEKFKSASIYVLAFARIRKEFRIMERLQSQEVIKKVDRANI